MIRRAIIESMGFMDGYDLYESLFARMFQKWAVVLGLAFAGFEIAIVEWVGIDPITFAVLVFLFILEMVFGVLAALNRGERIQGYKLVRTAVKLVVYMLLLGIVHIFSKSIGGIDFGDLAGLNVYSLIYQFVLNVVILAQLRSVFESLADLGIKEVKTFIDLIDRLTAKVTGILGDGKEKSNEPDEEC